MTGNEWGVRGQSVIHAIHDRDKTVKQISVFMLRSVAYCTYSVWQQAFLCWSCLVNITRPLWSCVTTKKDRGRSWNSPTNSVFKLNKYVEIQVWWLTVQPWVSNLHQLKNKDPQWVQFYLYLWYPYSSSVRAAVVFEGISVRRQSGAALFCFALLPHAVVVRWSMSPGKTVLCLWHSFCVWPNGIFQYLCIKIHIIK